MTIYIILFIYLACMLAIGIYGRKYSNNLNEFLVAGKQGTMLMVTASFMASHIGSGFVVGGAENAAIWGIGGVWYGLACAFSYFLFAALVARRVFRANYMTIPDYLSKRYGDKFTQVSFAAVDILASTGIIGGQIMAGQRLFQALGMNGVIGAIITTIVVIGYASISGLWGVLMTDVVQVGVCLAGLLITCCVIFTSGDWSAVISTLPASAFTAIPFDSKTFVLILVPTTLYGIISQASYQRVAASKTEKVAVGAPLWGGLLLIPVAFLPVIIGMYGKALYPDLPNGIVFFQVLLDKLPNAISGLMIAAILAAIMSTADSQLLGITAHVSHDLYEKNINPNATQKQLVTLSVATTAIVGAVALWLSLSFSNIISLLSFVYTILVAGFLVPVFGGMVWQRGTAAGALASTVVGVPIVLLHRAKVFTLPHTILVLIPCAVIYIIVSLMTKNKEGSDVTA